MAGLSAKPPILQELWTQFANRGKLRVDSLAVQAGLDGSGGHSSAADVVYARVLKALSRVSPSDASLLIGWLSEWRKGCISSLSQALQRQMAVEVVYMEALVKVVSGSGLRPSAAQFRDLETIAFDWVIKRAPEIDLRQPDQKRLQDQVSAQASQLLGVLSGSHLEAIQARYLGEVKTRLGKDGATDRQQLLSLCWGMRNVRLGFSNSRQLESSTDFLDRANPLLHVANLRKSQVQHAMCDMLAAVLRPYVRSDVPRCDVYLYEPASLGRWFATVAKIRGDLQRWIKSHAKHAGVGYPLLTQLVCLQDDKEFLALVDADKGSVTEALAKGLKDKALRTMALECLLQLVSTYLRRFTPPLGSAGAAAGGAGGGPPSPSGVYKVQAPEQVTSWLERTIRPVMGAMKKGTFASSPEQQDLVRRLCVMVAQRAPEYAVSRLVLDLMASEGGGPWECMLCGLQALREVLVTAPDARRPSHPKAFEEATSVPPDPETPGSSRAGGGGVSTPSAVPRISSGMSANDASHDGLAGGGGGGVGGLRAAGGGGGSAFAAYGIKHLEGRVASSLGDTLKLCHQSFGMYKETGNSRMELMPKEKWQGLPVLLAALRCVPYIAPEHMSADLFKEQLPSYTVHSDERVRSVAADVLRRTLRSHPDRREALLFGLRVLISGVQDEHEPVLERCVGLLDTLMRDWHHLLREERDNDGGGGIAWGAGPGGLMVAGGGGGGGGGGVGGRSMSSYSELSAAAAQQLAKVDLHPIEGQALTLLCHPSPRVRMAAWRALGTVRLLHRELLATAAAALVPPPATPASVSVSEALSAHTAGGADPDDPLLLGDRGSVSYAIDVIEQGGPQIVSCCYWDYGPWSDLHRLYRPAPVDDVDEGTDIKALLLRRTGGSGPRCCRLLAEVVRQVGLLSRPERGAAHWAYVEAANRLRVSGMVVDEGGGRFAFADLPQDHRRDLCCMYSCVATAAPWQQRDSSMSIGHLCRALTACLRSPLDWQLQMAMLALGHINAAHFDKLVSELQEVIREYNMMSSSSSGRGSKGRPRRDELRCSVGHIWRQVVAALPPGRLKSNHALRNEVIKFVRSTMELLLEPGVREELLPELVQLRYSLCSVVRVCGLQLGRPLPMVFSPDLRSTLFDLVACWCKEGSLALVGRHRDNMDRSLDDAYRTDLRERVVAAKARVKDAEAARSLEGGLIEGVDMLEHAAHEAMAALLMGPLFDSKCRSREGRPLSWIDRMFKAAHDSSPALRSQLEWGGRSVPNKGSVATRALTYLLESNTDCFPTVLDQCYSTHHQLAKGYFQVLVEVYSMHGIACQPHLLLSLVLYKLVDDSREVRNDALQLLHVLSQREWHTGGGGGPGDADEEDGKVAVVIGGVPDSYHQLQYHLSAKLARDHPELSEGLCVEVMRRQLECQAGALRHQVLLALIPWVENLGFAPRWQGNWSGSLLWSMYHVTLQHGAAVPHELERLWSTVAANKRNVLPIVDFLIAKGEEECAGQSKSNVAQYFNVAKRVALYLARMSPQQTIDHLAFEITQLFLQQDEGDDEDDDGAGRGRSRPTSPGTGAGAPGRDSMDSAGVTFRALEFQHQGPGPESGPPPHQPHRSHSPQRMSSLQSLAHHHHPGMMLSSSLDDALMSPSPSGGGTFHSRTGSIRGGHHRHTSSLQGLATELTGPIRKAAGDVMRAVGVTTRSESGSSRLSTSLMSLGLDPPGYSSLGGGTGFANSRAGGGGGSEAGGYSPMALSRVASVDITRCATRGPLTRPELALCLLAELAYEHDEDLRGHLALLCHVAVILMDSGEPVVYRHCQQLLVHLLYSLSARHLEIHHAAGAMLSEYRHVSSLIKYLQSMAGRRLWQYEDASLACPRVGSCRALESLVTEVVGSSQVFETRLRERWADEALKWVLRGSCQHLACRSHQVYRALRPSLSLRAVTGLLSGLHKCLACPTTKSVEVAVEVLLTLQSLVDGSSADKLVLYPQLLLACLPLLQLSYVQLFTRVLELFSKLVRTLDLGGDVALQNVLLVSCPRPPPMDEEEEELGMMLGGAGVVAGPARSGQLQLEANLGWVIGNSLFGPRAEGFPRGQRLWAVQQLLVKGLFRPESETLTVQAMLAVLQHVPNEAAAAASGSNGVLRGGSSMDAASVPPLPLFHGGFQQGLSLVDGYGGTTTGLGALMGDPELQVALSLWSLLPWLCLRGLSQTKLARVALKVMRYAAAHVGFGDVAQSLAEFVMADEGQLQASISHLTAVMSRQTFPRYARLALQRLVELLQRWPSAYAQPVLLVLHYILRTPGLHLGGVLSSVRPGEQFVMQPVAQLLDSALGPQALEVLEAVLHYSSGGMQSEHAAGGGGTRTDGEGQPLDWPSAINLQGWEANKAAVSILARVLDSPQQGSSNGGAGSGGTMASTAGGRGAQQKIMPFIETPPISRRISLADQRAL